MKSVGLRELKNRLAEYVRQVRTGEAVLVTDRGDVVAELGPPTRRGAALLPSGLVDLARRQLLTIGEPNDPSAYPELPRALQPHRGAQLLDEERGPR